MFTAKPFRRLELAPRHGTADRGAGSALNASSASVVPAQARYGPCFDQAIESRIFDRDGHAVSLEKLRLLADEESVRAAAEDGLRGSGVRRVSEPSPGRSCDGPSTAAR
jgi:hypothetical protein